VTQFKSRGILLKTEPETLQHLSAVHFGIIYVCVCVCVCVCGPGSSVGTATDYGLDGPGWNPGGDEIFRPTRPTLGPTQPSVKWVRGLSRG